MARRKKKSKTARGRHGRFVSKSKHRKVRRASTGGAPRLRKRKAATSHVAKRRTHKRATHARKRSRARRRHVPTTKAMRKLAAKHGLRLVRRRKPSKRRRRTGTRARVARHMASAMKHATYPIANPARRRRRRKHNPGRHNPRHRRMRRNPHRRYRRNPSVAGLMMLAKKAVPVLASMLGGKLLVKQVAARIPGVDKLGSFQGTALASGMLLLGSVLTDRIGGLKKFKDQIMLGLGLNVATELLSMTPLKGMLGLGEGIYDRALSDYVTTADYLTTGAMPIDDNIALSEYVTTGGLEEELGLSEELGVSEELGALDAATVRGGVSQMAMIKSIPGQQFAQDIPARTFTQGIASAGPGYDNPGALYAGVFRGGF